jgi:hypothetical protein
LQETEVQFPGYVGSVSPPEGGADGVVDDAVLVAPAFRVFSGVEALIGLHAAPERDVLREHSCRLVRDHRRLQVRFSLEGDDLPAGVHARVCAAGDAELHGMAEHGLQPLR